VSAPALALAAGWCAVAAALPQVRLELGASATGALTVVLALLAPAAALVIPAGRLARRPAFGAGLLLLVAGAMAAALADSVVALAGAAALQGAGAAALLAHAGPLGPPVLQAALCGLALALGPIAGGLVVEAAGWRCAFWLVLPLAAVAALGARGRPAEGRPTLVTPAACALVGAYATVSLLVPQYGRFVLERSAAGSALLLVPAGAVVVALSVAAGRRAGERAALAAGLISAAAGMLALTFVDADTGLRALLPGTLVLGAGLGLAGPRVLSGTPTALPLAGAALILAASGGLASWVQSDRRDAGASFDAAMSDGLAATGWMLVALLVLAAALALLLPRLAQAKVVSSTPS
jgi:MFS family permease